LEIVSTHQARCRGARRGHGIIGVGQGTLIENITRGERLKFGLERIQLRGEGIKCGLFLRNFSLIGTHSPLRGTLELGQLVHHGLPIET